MYQHKTLRLVFLSMISLKQMLTSTETLYTLIMNITTNFTFSISTTYTLYLNETFK